jgi:hypothetical protein
MSVAPYPRRILVVANETVTGEALRDLPGAPVCNATDDLDAKSAGEGRGGSDACRVRQRV